MGYAGGTAEKPTYHRLGDHTETIQIDYDPTRVSYEHLLEIFWDSHDPTARPGSRQYKAAVFYHDEPQKKLAFETRKRLEERTQRTIRTEILPAGEFYPAEAYHQKHRLQQFPELMREFRAMYPENDGLVRSTSAARVNGYLAGFGTMESLVEEIGGFGLTPEGQGKLLDIVRSLRRE